MRSESLRILEPCSVDWERMDGDGNVRFCRLCKKNVTDLSSMSEEEAEAFLAAGDQPCIRYVHDAHGDIVFKDRLSLFLGLAGAAAALAFGVLASGGSGPPADGGALMGAPPPRPQSTASAPKASTRAAPSQASAPRDLSRQGAPKPASERP